jgi:hypothetical protein
MVLNGGALLVAPQYQGSFFVTAGATGLIGSLPYALLGSVAELLGFLKDRMCLNAVLIGAVLQNVERGQCFGRNIRLSDRALEAVMQHRTTQASKRRSNPSRTA